MKPRTGRMLLTIALGWYGLTQVAEAQRIVEANQAAFNACAGGNFSGAITVHASQRGTPFLNLCDGHALAGNLALRGQSQPLTLAAGDFDEDGVPDLLSGFASGKGGVVTVHRGNVNALWPYGATLRNGPPPAFFPSARTFSLPEAPDFLATGDFDADGHWDVVTAQRGSNALFFLRGDGHGGFRAPQRIPLLGNVTAMIAGEINRADGLTDLAVGLSTANGPRVLVFESPSGALKGEPEIFTLAHSATALALGRYDGGAMNDLAVAAGDELVVIHGRDRKLSSSQEAQASVAPARVTVQKLSFAIQALTAGDFTGAGPGVAALGEDGQIHILEHALAENNLLKRMIADPAYQPTIQTAKAGKDGKPAIVGATMTPGMASRLEAIRESVNLGFDAAEWTEKNSIALPAGFSQNRPRLLTARVSGSVEEDILAPDSGNKRLHLFSTISNTHRPGLPEAGHANTPARMTLLDSLAVESTPAAVLPMRLSKSGLSGLVVLQSGQAEPTLIPQDAPPANTFTVTNTSDAIIKVGPEVTGPAGSLRKAIYDASQTTGTSSITFNIPTTDPGYNSATGTFLIQPLSESVPGALNNFALNPINGTVIIDGYTQPGASPNTLANGDNAKLLIQIDGGKATTPGGSGLVPFDDVGSVYRGLVFTGWTNPAITTGSSGSTASGAEGMEANGVQDFIEGNFFGTDPTGKVAAPNRIGVFADNGPGFGSTAGGNIIGGTTLQARNILSGNDNSGILFLSTAFEAQLQGNFIGLDVTGAAIVSNPQEAGRSNSFDGAGLNGATITIGGTLPGTANVIAGNGTNVDINDLTEGGQARDSIVQGNLIGTDVTGTIGIPNQGYGVSILHNPTNMLIGGTTPAARNVISANLAGVYIFDHSFNNIVQGNYIGVDITGTKALANVGQGFITGATGSTEVPAGDTTIGGSVAGAGNVISGNTLDGIQISGTSLGPNGQDQVDQGNFVLGNFIGTDATGKASIPNGGNGIDLISSATNNIIGGSAPGSANLIANNALNGVLIDPGATAGTGTGNNTIANIIQSNVGSGVRINSGKNNRISQNSIFANGDLGINLQNAGPNLNTTCNSTNTGANNLQNAPSLTAGSGSAFITATATDPNGNTSEFSNAVKSSISGNLLDLLGNFNSTPSTTYTIEFFSSTVADPSGFGEGQTYLTSTSVTTGANCTIAINDPVDTTQADLGVKLTSDTTVFDVGPDFGQYQFTGAVTNNGPATAHNVVLTDTLPAGLVISSAYCDVGPCQLAAVSSLGNCTVSGNKITCNLGTMAPGATAQATIPVQATGVGSLADTASVTATEADPNLANNTASLTETVEYPFPFIDHLAPVSALTQTSGSVAITVYGNGFLPNTAITFNGTAVTTTAYFDNQVCGGPFSPGFCSAIRVSVPASLLGAAGTATVTATNPDPGPGGGSNFPSSSNFTLVSSCTYSAQDFGFNPVEASGDTLIPESIEVTTNAPTCPWTAVSNAPWLVVLDNASGAGSGSLDVAVAPNTGAARSGTVTVAGQAVQIDQAAGDTTICTYGLNPGTATIPAAGATGTFAVTTGSRCSYFIEPFPQDSSSETGVQFITIPQSSSLLVGNGNPSYTVAANHGAPRNGAIMVGGDVFTLTQNAPACYYTLSTTSATLPVGGGTGTIGVTPSSPSCVWTAKSSDASLLSVTAGASGTGNGTVSYSVPVNAEGPQTATITVGDTTGYTVFTENQTSAFACTFTISPPSVEVTSNGVSNFFGITASYSFCKWTAVSSDPTSLTVDDVSGQAGLSTTGSSVGSGAVYYRVAQNATGAPRILTITAGCQIFTINQGGALASNPLPAITSLLPSSATAGSGAFTLTVNGSGFINGSVVNFGGNARTTTFVNANQVTAAILASDVANVGTPAVTVTNPTPGGGTSNALTFSITAASNPLPAITTLLPATTTAGSGAFTLTVNGSGFINGSVVNFNGNARTTTFASANQVTAAILASDVANVGTPAVTVTNPTPGGGTSNALTFTITAASNPLPAITALLPASATAGSGAFTLTVNGSSFVNGAVVNFNGNARTTTFVSANQVTAAILASDVANVGTPAITVTNPTPGGGTSNALTFSITAASNPLPAITTLLPSSVTAGSGAFTLTVNGSGFINGSVVNFGGNARTTTFVNANQVTAAILAGDVANVGTPAVTVTNPTPGGGTSNSLTFTITAASNPLPAITTLLPASTTAGSGAFTLTVNGSSLVNGAVVNFNGNAKTTTYVSANQVTAAILASDVANVGTPAVTVTNPTPGGGTSNALTFSITAAAVATASLTPASLSFTAVTGTTAAAQVATLTNTGNAPLTGIGISITGANPSDFTQSATTCGTTLAVNASCTISITFTPATSASFAATLSVADNAASSPQTTSLSGTGTAAPSFTVSSSGGSQTVQPGGTAQYSITVTAQNGTFSSPVTLSASGLPPGATSTFLPSSITPNNSSATSQLSIQTASAAAAVGAKDARWPLALPAMALIGLFFLPDKRRRRWITLAVLLFASLGALTALTGCGGGFGLAAVTNSPTPKTYTVTITGASGAVQQSTTVQLTVQ